MSEKCKPVVGSSKINKVLPVSFLYNSEANFTLWASPPDNIVDGWPNLIYPNPTSSNAFNLLEIFGWFLKKNTASDTVISKTSEIDFPLYLTSSVSLLYLFPWQDSQFTKTLGKKSISTNLTPAPLHVSHLPPFTLNEKAPCFNPLIFDSVSEENKFLISVNTPVYVAGFDLGVLPIGDWSTSINLLIFSKPVISLNGKHCFLELYNSFFKYAESVPCINDDFPLPDTPVIHTIHPRGMDKFTFLKLFPIAPFIFKTSPFPTRLFLGTWISNSLVKNLDVRDFCFKKLDSLPWATTLPPLIPGPGPISIILSADSIISLSCSTTITVFPKSLNSFRESISLLLSLWCSPILGSSSIYNTPTNFVPIWVANLILWASPPDKVRKGLSKLRYSKPRLYINSTLCFISFIIGSAIIFCSLLKWFWTDDSQLFKPLISIELRSDIEVLFSLKYKDSFFNLFPEQASHFDSVIKSVIKSFDLPDLNFNVFFIKPLTPLNFVCHNVPGYFVDSTATSIFSPYNIISKISSGIFFIGVVRSSSYFFKMASIFLKIHMSLYWPNGAIAPLLILKFSSRIIFSFKILSWIPSPLQDSHQP